MYYSKCAGKINHVRLHTTNKTAHRTHSWSVSRTRRGKQVRVGQAYNPIVWKSWVHWLKMSLKRLLRGKIRPHGNLSTTRLSTWSFGSELKLTTRTCTTGILTRTIHETGQNVQRSLLNATKKSSRQQMVFFSTLPRLSHTLNLFFQIRKLGFKLSTR